MDYPGVYSILCVKTGKRYIGCSKWVETRMKDHKSDLKRGKHINIHLQRAWEAYGEEYFVFEVLIKTDTPFEDEIRLIAEYDSFNNGYNLTPGGEGVGSDSPELCAKRVATFKKNYSEETKKKKSEAARRQLMSMSEEDRRNFAKIGSEAAKEAIESLSEEDKAIRSKELSEYSKRRWGKLDKEERSRQAKALWEGKSEEEKKASALKSWETRRKNAENKK